MIKILNNYKELLDIQESKYKQGFGWTVESISWTITKYTFTDGEIIIYEEL